MYNGKDSAFTQKAEALYKAAQETLEEVGYYFSERYGKTLTYSNLHEIKWILPNEIPSD